MPLRLDDQCAHTKRTDAMVNEPMAGLVDAAAGRRLGANRLAGAAFDHHQQSMRSAFAPPRAPPDEQGVLNPDGQACALRTRVRADPD